MFTELESLRGASNEEERERRKELAEQVTIELVRHSVAEEVLVYPKVEREDIRHHIEDEEGQMFTHMRQVIDEEEETLQRRRCSTGCAISRPAAEPTTEDASHPGDLRVDTRDGRAR